MRKLWVEATCQGVPAQLLRLSFPIFLTALVQVCISVTDLAFVGELGSSTLAEAALATAFYQITMVFGTASVSGILPLLASRLDANKDSAVQQRSAITQGIWLSAALAAFGYAGLGYGTRILQAFGHASQVADQAGIMLSYMRFGIFPALVFVVLRSAFTAKGEPGTLVFIVVSALFINGVFGWLIIAGHCGLPSMGLVGAGVANSVSNTVLCLGTVITGLKRYGWGDAQRCKRLLLPDIKGMMEIIRVGLPIGIASLLDRAVFFTCSNVAAWLGPAELAAHAVVMQLTFLFFLLPSSLGQATIVVVARASERDEGEDVRSISGVACLLALCTGILSGLAIVLFRDQLLSVFMDPSLPVNAKAIAISRRLTMAAAAFLIFDSVQIVITCSLRGLRDTTAALLLSVIGYWLIGVPLSLFLALHTSIGLTGIWVGLTSAFAITSILVTIRLITLTKPHRKPVGRLRRSEPKSAS